MSFLPLDFHLWQESKVFCANFAAIIVVAQGGLCTQSTWPKEVKIDHHFLKRTLELSGLSRDAGFRILTNRSCF